MATTILLVDDHLLFRKGLHLLLEEEEDLRVVGETGGGQTAIELVRELSPDVVVMDITMPDVDGIEATERILAEFTHAKIMALSIHAEKHFVEKMLRAGAKGYLLKESAPEELVDGIRTVARGEFYLSTAITGVVVSQYVGLLLGERGVDEESGLGEVGATPLLRTKLYRPPLIFEAVPRARLLELLEEGRWRQLTLVSAAAGYGKSTLVSHWLEETALPSAWLSLDERASDLRLFLTYFVAAVQTIFAEGLQITSALLKAPVLPPPHVLAGILSNELEHVAERFILVLDDYHTIHGAAIHDLLNALLRHPPQSLHLVLATRMDPSLDLVLMRARRQMQEIRVPELRFTTAEVAAFLQQQLGRPVEETTVALFAEKTEGWVTGMHLMVHAMRDATDLDKMLRSLPGDHLTLDYLLSEALSHQPKQIQDWLLRTSILERFCAPFCEAVCGSSDEQERQSLSGEEFIHWLTERNLFVIPLDHRHQWFRYHHMFQGLLQKELENTLDSNAIADLRMRASRWLANHGLIDEAFQQALAAGDIPHVIQMVRQYRYAMMNAEQWDRLEHWLQMIPHEIAAKNPMLIMTEAYISERRGQITDAYAYRDRAETLLSELPPESPEARAIRGEIAVLHGEQCLLLDKRDLAVQYAEQGLELLPAEALFVRSYGIALRALEYQMSGDLGRALRLINDAPKARGSSNGIFETKMVLFACIACWMDGNLTALARHARRCLDLGEQLRLPESISFGRYFLGVLHYVRNELPDAEHYLAALYDAPYNARPRYFANGCYALALVHAARGQAAEAARVVDSVISHAMELNATRVAAESRAFEVELALRQGQIEQAANLSQNTFFDLLSPLWFFYVSQLSPAKLLLAQSRPETLEQACTILEQLDDFLVKNHRKIIRIDLLALQALALDARGEKRAALEKLSESLTLAEPGGFIRNFVDLGPDMARLLRGVAAAGVAQNYIAQILDAFVASPPPPGTVDQSKLIEPLTDREFDVLSLLSQRLTYDEVAQKLVVSPNTIKKHAVNIHEKLGVHGRRDAIAKAKALGILPQ